MAFGLKNDNDLICQILLFCLRPGDCEIARVDEESQEYHGMSDDHIPFIVTDAADSSVFRREAVKFMGCSDGLMESLRHVGTICNHCIVVDKSRVEEQMAVVQ